jgi:hypothetical protein
MDDGYNGLICTKTGKSIATQEKEEADGRAASNGWFDDREGGRRNEVEMLQ